MKKVSKKNNLLKFGVLVVILAALPISVNLVEKSQENRSQAAAKECGNSDNCCTGSPNFGTCIKVADQGIPNKKGQACKTTDGRDGKLVFNVCLDHKWGPQVGKIRCCATKINPNDPDTDQVTPMVTNKPAPTQIPTPVLTSDISSDSKQNFPQYTGICQSRDSKPSNIKSAEWNINGRKVEMTIFEPNKKRADKRIYYKYDAAGIDNGAFLMEIPEKYRSPKTDDKYDPGDVCFESWNYGYSPYFVDKRVIPAYEAMIGDLWADGAPDSAGKLRCGYRDPKLQDLLYQRVRNSSLVASKCGSAHRTGKALDMNISRKVSFISKKSGKKITVHQWFVENAAKYGFRRYSVEDWHWEYNP